MTIAPPKTRTPPKVDLSGLSDEQQDRRARVIRLGEIAFGARWMSDFAAALTKEAGRTVRYAQVSQWVIGYRPVPESLEEPLTRLAFKVADQLAERAAFVRSDWKGPPPEDVASIENARRG